MLFRSDSIFGVIVSEDNLKAFQRGFQDDEIQLIERYDMNPQGPGERTHRPRLWRDFFVVRTSKIKQQ